MTSDENVKLDHSLRKGPRDILRESGPPGRRSAPIRRPAALTVYERFSQDARSGQPLDASQILRGKGER